MRAYAHPGRSSGINRRDVEVEQSWCEDLARINKLLAERGILADIAHQEGLGTTEQILIPARRERSLDIGPAREIERTCAATPLPAKLELHLVRLGARSPHFAISHPNQPSLSRFATTSIDLQSADWLSAYTVTCDADRGGP